MTRRVEPSKTWAGHRIEVFWLATASLLCAFTASAEPPVYQDTPRATVANTIAACVSISPGSSQVVVASPWLDFSAGAIGDEPDSNFIVAWFANRLPRADGRLGGLPLSDTYKAALEYHEAALPVRSPTEIERASRARSVLLHERPWLARLILGRGTPGPSKELETYRSYARQYRAFVYSYQTATADADKNRIAAQIKDTERDWNAIGFKRQIDDALEAIDLEVRSDPQSHWSVASRGFAGASQITARGSKFFPAVAAPAYSEWNSDVGWIHCAGGGGSVSLDVKTVVLDRPWFNEGLIFSKQWRWISGAPYPVGAISDGSAGVSTAPGWVPLLPRELVLIRNASIQLSPGVQLRTSTAQVGGWIVSPTEKSPDPDATLHWPSDPVSLPPESSVRLSVAAMTAVTWGATSESFGDLRRTPLWLNPAILVDFPKKRIGAVVGSGLGPQLRGTGLILAVSTPVSGKIRGFVFGGVRVPLTADDNMRGIVGLGIRLWSGTR